MADNFHFDISCAPLDKSLEIAFQGSPSKKATHWQVNGNPQRLILAWSEDKNYIPFPGPVDASGAEVFVRAWLDTADYGLQPDHDGDNSKSWRIYNESWSRVGVSYGFVAIEPIWAIYGK